MTPCYGKACQQLVMNVTCTSSLFGTCCGHVRSEMLNPFMLPIAHRQGCYNHTYTVVFPHRYPAPMRPHESSPRALDVPLLARDFCSLEEVASSSLDRARLLAETAAHGSELIFALPITVCGLRLSNEAIGIIISLRSGLSLGEPLCVNPHYCNAILYGVTKQNISCLKHVQNLLALVMCLAPYRIVCFTSPSPPTLPVHERITFKIARAHPSTTRIPLRAHRRKSAGIQPMLGRQ